MANEFESVTTHECKCNVKVINFQSNFSLHLMPVWSAILFFLFKQRRNIIMI